MALASFIVPTATVPSGGHAYNRAVIAGWPGVSPGVVSLPGPWPKGDRRSLSSLRDALRLADTALVDGLVGAAHPELLAEATERGCRIVLLVHLPLADEGGLTEPERRDLAARELASLHQVARVVATSRSAACELSRRTGRDDIAAVPPGVHRAGVVARHEPVGILQVGSIGPRKNQLASLAALAACGDLPWRATFVGPVAQDGYARRFQAGLDPARARWTGPLQGDALEDAFAQADLLLHPATAETWGMVVTEALARGIPAIVGAGTGAVEALASGSSGGDFSGSGSSDHLPGASVSLDSPGDLARMLRRWLTSVTLREEWRARAIAARDGLRGWPAAASELAHVLEEGR